MGTDKVEKYGLLMSFSGFTVCFKSQTFLRSKQMVNENYFHIEKYVFKTIIFKGNTYN